MKTFDKIISIIEEFVLAYSVIVMAILLIISVIMRTVFNQSLTFSEEIGQSLLIIVSFFGISYTAKKGRHITMSIFFDMVNNNKKKIMMYITSIVSTIIMIYIAYLAGKYALSTYDLGRVTPALRIPIYMIYVFVPIGMIFGAFEYLRTFMLNLKHKDYLYLTTEIRIPMDEEINVDLNSLIEMVDDTIAEKAEKVDYESIRGEN